MLCKRWGPTTPLCQEVIFSRLKPSSLLSPTLNSFFRFSSLLLPTPRLVSSFLIPLPSFPCILSTLPLNLFLFHLSSSPLFSFSSYPLPFSVTVLFFLQSHYLLLPGPLSPYFLPQPFFLPPSPFQSFSLPPSIPPFIPSPPYLPPPTQISPPPPLPLTCVPSP